MTAALIDVAAFDALAPMTAGVLLTPVCGSEAWIVVMVARRPYGSLAAMAAMSDEVLTVLNWADIEQALNAHPRIGDRARGEDREAAWSREEQAATASAADDDLEALRAGNAEYEQRFGHVFLICATGLAPAQLLAALRERLANDAEAEREIVRRELKAIVALRLAKTMR